MKKWKKMFISFLTICMLFSLSAIHALAAEEEPYTYTVRLYAGNKGTVNGQSVITVPEIVKDGVVDFTGTDIQVTDAKYYVKGIRLSGRDNEEVFSERAFQVTNDTDYVVAYGIQANRVSYTVNYLDADGNVLAPGNTYYGDVGDKPVVAYRYIENYVPQALALTKTLSANEAENVFDFVYRPGEAGITIPGETTVITVTEGTPATTTTTPGTAAGAAGGTTAGTTAAGTAAGNAAATETPGAAEEGAGGETVENPDEETPQGVVDLDDEDTPKANIDAKDTESRSATPIVIGGVVIAVSIGALVALILALKKRSK